MNIRLLVPLLLLVSAWAADMPRPRAGKVEIFPAANLKPGMKATAWTVLAGKDPEPIPIEIVGLLKNAWGPKQDIIIGKMGGPAQRTNVAGGMSGSPVYIDGKLVGAVALRLSVFSPDAICGITPIELMLEINDLDQSVPSAAKAPTTVAANLPGAAQTMVPIETPLTFSGFSERAVREFAPMFRDLGMAAVQGGASAALSSPKPAAGWQTALNPGDPVAGVLVSGDMSITGLGTVTYNDGKRVLAFGHPFFNMGPVDMPMSKGEILMTLASQYQPNKLGNATEIVGALRQDRHSGIMGELGTAADMIPVDVKVRRLNGTGGVLSAKDLHFNVFVNQRWTPYLMMVTLFNSIEGLNDYSDEASYSLNATVELAGKQRMALSTMTAPSEIPQPAPMALSMWWADKFNRLFMNSVETPQLKSARATIDLYPDRRVAAIENAWLPAGEVEAGSDVPVRVFLRPYRGERMQRDFVLHVPQGLPRGDHRVLLSDADTLNRMQTAASMSNRYMDIPQTVSLINQERTNNRLYVSIVNPRPTVYSDDKTLPSLPASVLNVMQTGRTASRPMASSAESAVEQTSIPFDRVISGSYSLRITVK